MTVHKALDAIHDPMKKTLRAGQQIAEIGLTLKALWDVGKTLATGARAIGGALAPAAATAGALL